MASTAPAKTGAYDQLYEANERLDGAIKSLHDRLTTVMEYPHPDPEREEQVGSSDLESLVWSVRDKAEQIVGITDRIRL